MSLRINTNVDSLTAYRNLTTTQNSMSTSIERLSSGLRINKAADDAAGLAISQGLTAQINGIGQAQRNAQDGINVVQTADGALNESQAILQRMRTLAVQSANDSNDQSSRNDIQTEVTSLQSELDKIANTTTFNNVKVLDGSFTGKQFQVGYAKDDTIGVNITSNGSSAAVTTFNNGASKFDATAGTPAGSVVVTYGSTSVTANLLSATNANKLTGTTSDANAIAAALNGDAGFANSFTASVDDKGGLKIAALKSDGSDTDTISTTGALASASNSTATAATTQSGSFNAAGLGVDASHLSLTSQSGAESAIATIDTAIQQVSTARANLGALQNTFQHQINNLSVTQENLQASNSAITDTDMAQEMSNYSRTQILSQAGTSMLKQANQASQGVLSLLQ